MLKKINLLFIVLMYTGCGIIPNTYIAAPISGSVLDKENEQPLVGVHVVIYWQLHKGGLAGRVASDILYVEETTTDENGKYYFKGWGPTHTFKGRLSHESPEILFFKQGYYYQRKSNSRTQMYFGKRGAGEIHVPNAEEMDVGQIYRSQFDEKNIYLKKYDENITNIVSNFSGLGSDIHIIFDGKGCESLRLKNIFTIYSKAAKGIEEKYSFNPDLGTLWTIRTTFDNHCGEVIKIYSGEL